MKIGLRYLVLAILLTTSFQISFLQVENEYAEVKHNSISSIITNDLEFFQENFCQSPEQHAVENKGFGDQEVFWVFNYTSQRFEEQSATLAIPGQ